MIVLGLHGLPYVQILAPPLPVSEIGSELNPHKSRISTYCLINVPLTTRVEPNQPLVASVENHVSISIRQSSLN